MTYQPITRELVNEAKRKRESGSKDDDILMFLRYSGLTIIDSIKVVMEVYGLSLRDAKVMVAGNTIWAAEAKASEPLQEDFIKAFSELQEKKSYP